jgi:hypothetical protein
MNVAYSPVFVDELFARRDLVGLYALIRVRSRTRKMSDACELFCRSLEWSGATRSGIWQYYESLKEEEFLEVCRLLGKFEMTGVLAHYRDGRGVWQSEEASAALDRWIDTHEHEIHSAILDHLRMATEELKKNEGEPGGTDYSGPAPFVADPNATLGKERCFSRETQN